MRRWKCKNCSHTEESLQAARDHSAYAHNSSYGLDDEDLIEKEEVQRDLATQTCPFCKKIPGQANFVGHICHHLEEVSWSAIPQDGELDESDEGSDKILSIASLDLSASSELMGLTLDEEKSLGKSSPRSPDTTDTVENARQKEIHAREHVRGGRHAKAEVDYARAAEIFERILGEKHRETLLAQKNLAWTLQRQGKYNEAEKIYRKILDSMAETLGSTHPETLVAYNSFAVVLADQGRYVEAEAVNRQVLRGREDTLAPDHPFTLQSINNLAEVLDGQDRWEEAKVLYQRAIDGRKRAFGENHNATKQSIDNLAKMLEKGGVVDSAMNLR